MRSVAGGPSEPRDGEELPLPARGELVCVGTPGRAGELDTDDATELPERTDADELFLTHVGRFGRAVPQLLTISTS